MPTSKQSGRANSKAAPVPIPGAISIQGPLPIIGSVDVKTVEQNWEYKAENPANAAQVQTTLDRLAVDGWEFVGTVITPQGTPMIFKRPKRIR